MKEQKVNFEQAKLLKELGFDWESEEVYNTEYSKINGFPTNPIVYDVQGSGFLNNKEKEHLYSAPTITLALKWVRDNHNIYIKPYRQWYDVNRPDNVFAFEFEDLINRKTYYKDHKSWEEAESHGLTLSLHEIKNRINKQNT